MNDKSKTQLLTTYIIYIYIRIKYKCNFKINGNETVDD